jgi:hypothetical protein
METWKDALGYEGYYQVSDLGRVRSVDKTTAARSFKGKVLKPKTNKGGYLEVHLSINGASYHEKVHRLVAVVFLDNPSNLPQVNHINGVKADNRAENLEWCTCKHNVNEAFRTGLNANHERHRWSILTIEQVREVLESNKPSSYFSEKFDISKTAIKDIRRGKSWRFAKERLEIVEVEPVQIVKVSGLPTGVYNHKQTGKFRAAIKVEGKNKHLGLFKTIEEAEFAYKEAKSLIGKD